MGESPNSRHCFRVSCCVTLTSSLPRPASSSKTFKTAVVSVGRNESRSLVLSLLLGQEKRAQPVSYLLSDVRVHHKFAASSGKGCIEIKSKNLQILFSNCPPERLNVFLKTIEAKLQLLNTLGTPVRLRDGLGIDVPRIYAELSPLTLAEIKKLRPGLSDATNRDHGKGGLTSKASPLSKGKKMGGQTPVRRKAARPTEGKMRMGSRRILHNVHLLNLIQCKVMGLTEEQRGVVRAVAAGESLFFTGSAGTGKSVVLRALLGKLPPESTFVTAATGVAACQIGGVTLHSFAGIGAGDAALPRCLELACRPVVAAQWRKCTHLVVDEISMIDADFFTKLDKIGRILRGKREAPFGGIQLILCGDFLQLPPVRKGAEKKEFCFQSPSWPLAIKRTILLHHIHRQSDPIFIKILQEIRLGRCSSGTSQILEGTRGQRLEDEKEGILPTKLATHKTDVDFLNASHLAELPGSEQNFEAVDSHPIPASLAAGLPPATLRLKVGAQVMLTKNLDLQRNLSNGSRGVVVAFKKYPVVKFIGGQREIMKPCRFFVKVAGTQGTQATRIQLPLQLAWAISIHKSQGMSLDRVEVSLGRVFEAGQAYVALSRATSLRGLRVTDFHPQAVRAHPDVLLFYRQLLRRGGESGDGKGVGAKRPRLAGVADSNPST